MVIVTSKILWYLTNIFLSKDLTQGLVFYSFLWWCQKVVLFICYYLSIEYKFEIFCIPLKRDTWKKYVLKWFLKKQEWVFIKFIKYLNVWIISKYFIRIWHQKAQDNKIKNRVIRKLTYTEKYYVIPLI